MNILFLEMPAFFAASWATDSKGRQVKRAFELEDSS